MMANTVEDPNHDPNLYSEIDVSSCDEGESLEFQILMFLQTISH